MVKSKLSPCSGSVALRQLNPIHKKGTKSFLSKIMQKFYSHINLNLTFKKIIHKSNLNFRLLPNFSFLSPLPKNIRCQDLISDVNFYLQNCTFLSTKCVRHFHEKKSSQFVVSLFGVWSWSRNSRKV